MIPLVNRETTDSELLVEEFRECDPCRAKPGSPTLCDSCLQNRTLIGRLKAVVRRSPLHHLKNVVRGAVFGLWKWDEK